MILQGKKYDLNADISGRVVVLIRDNGFRQADLCKEIEVPTTTLNGNINNKALWQIETLISIAKYFNVSLDYLILGKDNKRIKELEQELNLARNYLTTLLNDKKRTTATVPNGATGD